MCRAGGMASATAPVWATASCTHSYMAPLNAHATRAARVVCARYQPTHGARVRWNSLLPSP
eukprot:CAMPEP_0117502248 /NCGR_PEP_ID=MMETSP0784-20121206/23715_1 /TAXON_ID=39447 /ORGANISM="" /LENGTH=60 /DNA_ID=CAMNT_0005297525 /DNA_START=80 /DNA_END=259 /DNA_ORIENTATION=+